MWAFNTTEVIVPINDDHLEERRGCDGQEYVFEEP